MSKQTKRLQNAEPRTIEKEHNQRCLAAIRSLLEKERWDDPLSDADIGDALRADGLLCAKYRVFEIRRHHGIPNSRERKIQGFAKSVQETKG